MPADDTPVSLGFTNRSFKDVGLRLVVGCLGKSKVDGEDFVFFFYPSVSNYSFTIKQNYTPGTLPGIC